MPLNKHALLIEMSLRAAWGLSEWSLRFLFSSASKRRGASVRPTIIIYILSFLVFVFLGERFRFSIAATQAGIAMLYLSS